MWQKFRFLLWLLVAVLPCKAQDPAKTLFAIPNTPFIVSVKKMMADEPRKLVCFTLYSDSSFELQTAEVRKSKPRHSATGQQSQSAGPSIRLEAILDRAEEAQGKADLMRRLRTLRAGGTIFRRNASQPSGDFEITMKSPDKFLDVSMMTGSGGPVRLGFDGTEAWTIASRHGTSGLPRIQLLLPAFDWRTRYADAEFVGPKKVDARDTYVIRARIRGQVTSADYYYDATTFLLWRVDVSGLGPEGRTIWFLHSVYWNTAISRVSYCLRNGRLVKILISCGA